VLNPIRFLSDLSQTSSVSIEVVVISVEEYFHRIFQPNENFDSSKIISRTRELGELVMKAVLVWDSRSHSGEENLRQVVQSGPTFLKRLKVGIFGMLFD
jgi:hypothetical protein